MTQLQGVIAVSPSMRTFTAIVRAYLRDYAELNRLVAGQETNDTLVQWSILDAISRFNGTPHFTNFTLDDILGRNLHFLLLRMTVESIIQSVGLLQTRNHINYSDGGLNVGVNDKTPLLQSWLQLFGAYTEQTLTRVKVALNIESILGPENVGVHSEAFAVNMTYLSF
jgi:hypothetical protein